MDIKSLKEKLINAINNVFDEFDGKKDTEDICDDKDNITIITNDLEKISKKWSINFQSIIHGIESIINRNNDIVCLGGMWEVVSTEIKIDKKILEPLKYKTILNLLVPSFRDPYKLTLELEYWKHRSENVYAGYNEGMVRYNILLNDISKICGNTDLESPKHIIDNIEKVLYNFNN